MAKGGRQPGAGRPKGMKNKIPRNLKDRILHVWNELEEKGMGLHDEAEKDPPWFYVNFVKPMLPKNVELTGEDGGAIDNKITVEFVHADKDTGET